MGFKCQNCGSTKCTTEGNLYVCSICGEKISKDDLEEIQNKNEEDIRKFVERNESLFIDEDESVDVLVDRIAEIKKTLTSDINTVTRSMKESIIAELENVIQSKLPEFTLNKAESGKFTVDEVLKRSNDIDDYRVLAFLVRNNVEDNLINKFKVRHENKNFLISFQRYLDFCKKYQDENGNQPYKGLSMPIKPITYKTDENGDFILDSKGKRIAKDIEMPLEIRFIKAGLTYGDAKKATKYWLKTNLFIHPSPENNAKIENDSKTQPMNSLFNEMVSFFRDKGLLTIE